MDEFLTYLKTLPEHPDPSQIEKLEQLIEKLEPDMQPEAYEILMSLTTHG